MLWTAVFSIICKKMISGMKKLKYNRRHIFFFKTEAFEQIAGSTDCRAGRRLNLISQQLLTATEVTDCPFANNTSL